jgi:PleD family two-component response regulator
LLIAAKEDLINEVQAGLTAGNYDFQVCQDPKNAVVTTLKFEPVVIFCQNDVSGFTGSELARLFKRHQSLASIPF